MRFQNRKGHIIDVIFPISLFFVFAASSLAVLLLAANIYSSATMRTEENYTERTALAYITEKVRQNDSKNGISIGRLDNTDSLVLTRNINGTAYITYIYEHEGTLKELYLKEGVQALPKNGKIIMPVQSFQIEQLENKVFKFTTTDDKHHTTSIMIGSKCD